ncbi:MAG: esterase, partial [Gammaproteobacteria bacterium]|nr:esterase [Gammaproteobacteria bacterium]
MSEPIGVNDPRIDPRLKAMLAAFPDIDQGDVESREAAVAAANTPEARAADEALAAMFEMADNEEI